MGRPVIGWSAWRGVFGLAPAGFWMAAGVRGVRQKRVPGRRDGSPPVPVKSPPVRRAGGRAIGAGLAEIFEDALNGVRQGDEGDDPQLGNSRA